MAFFSMNRDDRGYTRGSLDVITAINLFLKFLLISPILLFAGYVSISMMKHVIFHGIPSMNKPTPEQIERLREADSQIGLEVSATPQAVLPNTERVIPVMDEEEARHHVATVRYRQAIQEHRETYREWVNCNTWDPSLVVQRVCEDPGQAPSFSTYYDVNYEE
jgi:hypothetical protein